MSSSIRTQSAPSYASRLKISGVERGRVVDDDHHLGLGVEVGPRADQQLVELVFASLGHMRRIYIAELPGSACSVWLAAAELAQLAVDLGLDVEWRLALACAALVAGDHELADLLAQGGIGARRRRRAAAASSASISASMSSGAWPRASRRADLASTQLADLGARLGVGGRAARRRARAAGRARRARTRRGRSGRSPSPPTNSIITATTTPIADDHEHHPQEGRPPQPRVCRMWRRLRRRTMAPSRPAIYPRPARARPAHRSRAIALGHLRWSSRPSEPVATCAGPAGGRATLVEQR